ncbi:MAG TPA: MFS transporter [Solirubrobacterales bacterium]|nr:MFS transporter [Solirubrobacterales bacterium]
MPADGQTLGPEQLPVASSAELTSTAAGHRVTWRLEMPYFGALWRPLIARRARRIERAADRGEPLPRDRPWWAPPEHLGPEQQATIAIAALLTAIYSFGGGTLGLLSTTLPAAADIYGADDSTLAVGLAVVRGGVVVALLVGTLADRLGRRRVIVSAAIAHCVLVAAIGLAPGFGLYVGGHLLLRTIDTALAIALAVIVIERVPARSRATSLALLAVASGIGIGLATLALPLAESGRAGFALAYGAQLLAIPLVLSAARTLEESPRFIRHQSEPHAYRELLAAPYRRRLLMLGIATLLAAAFVAPALEFLTQYLTDGRGLSAGAAVLLLGLMGLAAGPGLIGGGILADSHGRRTVAIPAFIASLAAFVAFYLGSGILPWIAGPIAAAIGAAGGAAAGPYGGELFPTRIRSAAQTLILVLTIVGSVLGLGAIALLRDSLTLGEAIAANGLGAVVAIIIFIAYFPETAGRDLDETSIDSPAARP